jgi:divalent metal cation (Fe/Co/Zn/Cd) transporter
MWAPVTTGLAVILSQSTTQLSDFLRRTVEFVALLVSWQVFRYLSRNRDVLSEKKLRLERFSGLSVATALFFSSAVMLLVTLSRLRTFEPGGNVLPGLAIACLGLITNSWFWRRYTRLNLEEHNTIIDAQRQLYRAKASVDVCVVLALAAVALWPGHALTRYVDLLGSLVVAGYLAWSGIRTLHSTLSNRQFMVTLEEGGDNIDE